MTSWQPEFDPHARPTLRSTVFAFAEGRVVVGQDVPEGELLHIGRLDAEPVFAVRHEGPAYTLSLHDALPI